MPTVNLMKLPDPAAQTAKFVNMMNATKQQEAAERQATIAQQRLDLETQEGERQEKTLESNTRKADLDYKLETAKRLRNLGVTVYRTKDPTRREAAYQSWLGMVDKADSEAASLIRQASDTYDADIMLSLLMETDKFIDANVPKATYSNEYAGKGGVDAQGRPVPEGTLLQVRNSLTPEVTPITSPTAARASTPVPTAAPPPTTSGPVPTGKFGETKVAPDGGQLDAFQQDHVRRMKEGLGMTDTPASFTRGGMATPTAGQMSPDMVPALIDSAVKTGVMAQIDLDQMLALAPPQARQGIVDVLRSNNVSLQADAPSLVTSGMNQQQPMAPNPVGRQQSQFADMRGPAPQASFADLGGQPQMQNTMAQYQPVQRRDPNMSPYPGSAQVPLSRVAGEAAARLEPIPRIKERKVVELQAAEDFEEANKDKRIQRKREEVFAGERAKKDSDFLESYNDAATKGRTTLNVISQMIGDAKIEKGNLVVPKDGRRPHPGFEGVVGMGVPGVRFIPGTQAASFDALFRQAEGGAFLQAYESLRGTGQITEIEGSKATSALTRMERSQTEVEFVKAAREFADVIRGAVARADKRYTALTGEAPPAAATQRKTSTSKLSPATRAKYGL
jgi:hypothetical protein